MRRGFRDFRITLCILEIHRSAGKHGVPESDVLHAIEHEIVSVDLEPEADPPKILVIGPDPNGNLLEVIVLVLADDRLIAIHAMKLRRQFYELLPGEEGPR
jgi:hypothetical protein